MQFSEKSVLNQHQKVAFSYIYKVIDGIAVIKNFTKGILCL